MRQFRFMMNSIRIQTLLILVLLFVSQIVLINVVLKTVMLDRINLMEQRDVEEYLAKSSVSLDRVMDSISALAYDWGMWDAAFDYVQGQNNNFVAENLADNTLGNLNLDFMVMYNREGNLVLTRQFSPDRGYSIPIDPAILNSLQVTRIWANTDPGLQTKGIVTLPQGLMIVASCPIMHNSGQGQVAGNVAVGRFLDQSEINGLAADLRINLVIQPLGQLDSTTRNDISGLTPGQPTLIKVVNEDMNVGYRLLTDINGQAAGVLTIDVPREISKIGNNGIKYVLRYTLMAFLLSILIVMAFLDRRILNRLARMSKQLADIGNTTMRRLQAGRNQDEITQVALAVNNMLDKEQELYLELQAAHDDLENKVMDRTAALNIANANLQEEMLKRQAIQEKITHLAYHDYLTDLPNRLLFTELLGHAMTMSQRVGKVLAVLFLDLDGFKNINDTLGHYAGDWLLKEVAARLVSSMRASDTIARLGGDEFIIMIENQNDLDGIALFARKILEAFDAPFILQKQICHITTSIGIAVFPTDGEDADTLIKNADIAMYQAKEKGKNQFAFCTTNMKTNVVENMRLTNYLYRAIEKNELELFYQPQVNCQSRDIIGLEALLRWHHPTEGMISPAVFIPIAEQTGLITTIGEWVLRRACIQNRLWQKMGLPKLRMAVNVSIRQLHNAAIIQAVQDVLRETGMDPQFLEIEITESAIMKDHHSVSNILAALKNMGVNIAIDDFGTEYSSLNYIKTLPVDRIKIAMPFIHGIDVSHKDEAIVKAIIVLAQSLNMNVIAEGVETYSQLDFLTERKCEEFQGYIYYKPMPADQIEQLLRSRAPLTLIQSAGAEPKYSA